MKNIIILVVSLFAVTTYSSATSTSTTSTSHSKSKKSSKTSLEFLMASEQMKSNYTGKHDGYYNKLDTSLLTKVNEDNEVRLYLSTRYLQYESGPTEFNWYLSEVMWRRKNLLTSYTDKVKLDFELKGYYMLEEGIREQYGFNGAVVPQFILKERVGDKWSVKLKLRRHIFDANSSDDYVLKTEDRAYLSTTYMYDRYMMFNVSLKYSNKIRNQKHYSYKEGRFEEAELQVLTFHPSILFLAGRLAMLEIYAESKLHDSGSELKGMDLVESEQVFGTAIYITAW